MALPCVSSSSSSLHFLLHRSSFPLASPRVSSGGLQSLSVRCVGGSPGSRPPVPNNINYMVPLDGSPLSGHPSFITRPLVEILRDLNKRVSDNVLKPLSPEDRPSSLSPSASIPWYHANRMLSFYAPGWCGEVRDVIYSDNGSVTVVYRVTIRGSDGEAHRESTGTVSGINDSFTDPVAAAEEIAFCRACARFGLGLYLYHDE